MKFRLDIRWFESALGGSTRPDFDVTTPARIALMIAEDEPHLPVALIDEEVTDAGQEFIAESADPGADYSALVEGAEFFVLAGPRTLGRGQVRAITF